MDTTSLEKYRAHAEKTAAFYVAVRFPLVYDRGQFGFYRADGGGVQWFHFVPDGLTYLLYRLGKYVDRDKAHELLSENKPKFTEYINAMRGWQETEKPRQQNKILYLALNTIGDRCYCYGLLTHYNPVSNASVIQRVKDSPIAVNVTSVELKVPKSVKLYCRSRYLVGGKLSFGLAIVNGETGHYTLGYHLYVASEDYTFLFPMQQHKRHLSKVGEVDDSLVTVLQAANAVEVDQVIKTTPASTFIDALPLAWVAKIPSLSIYNALPCESFIDYLTDLREERGYKTVVNAVLDHIFNQAFILATK